MKSSLLALGVVAGAATVVLVGCMDTEPEPVESASAPIIGGAEAVEGDYEAAVALVQDDFKFCSGTLVSPSVILTAGHCVDEASPTMVIHFGHDVDSGGRKIVTVKKRAHPNWNGDLANGHDIGMMLLEFAQDPNLAIPMWTASPDSLVGQDMVVVGFGIHNAEGDTDGKKRFITTPLSSVATHYIHSTATADRSICSGDSGGPAFMTIDGALTIVGVNSWGPQGCSPGLNGHSRIDTYWADFVQPWIDDNDPVCGLDGTCARVGCTDDPDCQPCGPDGTCTTGCPLPDPDCATAEVGDLCQANSQCVSGTCVWWQQDPQTSFCTRSCDPAANDCPSGMSCQQRPGVDNVCYYDDAPDGVVGDSCAGPADCGSQICAENVCVTECDLSVGITCQPGFACETHDGANYYCFDDGSGGGGGGCDVSSGGASSGLGLVWLLIGLCVVLRRRRDGTRVR